VTRRTPGDSTFRHAAIVCADQSHARVALEQQFGSPGAHAAGEAFVTELQDFVAEEPQLRLLLLPMDVPEEATASQAAAVDRPFAGRRDSLMQLLLRVATLQPLIVNLVLEKVRSGVLCCLL